METRKFPIKFLVCSSFCLGETGGSREFVGVLLVYSSFRPLHFSQSQDLEVDDAKPDCNYRGFRELSRFSTACSPRLSDVLSLCLMSRSILKILSITCRYSVLFPESKIGYFSESSPEMLRRAY